MFELKLNRPRFAILLLLAALALFVTSPVTHAQQTINVPADRATIQAAINAANNGDTVLVAPGTYTENINFSGKAITVKSSGGSSVTIIDGSANGSVVTFNSGETTASNLNGFTIQNGTSDPSHFYEGSGVFVGNSSPTIANNKIINNLGCSGIGIGVYFGSPVIQGNVITQNTNASSTSICGGYGGGILIDGSSNAQILANTITNNSIIDSDGGGIALNAAGTPTIRGNTISGNSASGRSHPAHGGGISMINQSDAFVLQNIIVGNISDEGGGVYALVPSGAPGPYLLNNTIANNNASESGSGILIDGFDAQAALTNNIIVALAGQASIFCGNFASAIPTFSFNDVFATQGGSYSGICADQTGQSGNISSDPLFFNPAGGDFHLKQGSLAIDAGNNSAPDLPQTDYDGNPRITDGNNDGVATVDLGAFELVTTSAANVAPNGLTFSLQSIGTTSGAQSATLTSTGTTPFQISSVQTSGDFSEATNCSAVVPSGASCTYSVTFAPTTGGPRAGSLVVNGTNGASLLVALTGTGDPGPNAKQTTTTVTSNSNPSTLGQSVTLTANIQSSSGGLPTGTVTFFDGATTLGTSTLSGSTVQFVTSALTAGSHSVTAKYWGDANFASSTSLALTQAVNSIQTTTTVTSSSNPSTFGQNITFTANVQISSGSSPTGTVTFLDASNSTTLGTSTLSGSSAQVVTSGLAVGSHSIVAIYSGDANFIGSSSSALTQIVNSIQTTTIVTSSSNPSTAGQIIVFTANVQISSGGSPTGLVTFFDGATTIGASRLSSAVGWSGSIAEVVTSTLAVGSHSITARYSGEGNFGGSTSSALTQTVNPIQTATTVSSSGNPSTFGQSVTFTANVQISSGSGPTGTVIFFDGATALGTSSLSNSSAQLAISSLAVGSHSITARYSGDANFAGSTSSALTQTVNPIVSSGLAIDAQAFKDQSTAKSSVATPAFSTTAANELLLAFVATDYNSGSNTTVTGITGGALTWTLVLRSNKQSGTSEIWRAFASSPLSGVTVTAALSHSVVSSLTVVSFTGVSTSGTNGSAAIGATQSTNASSGAPTATLVTTRNNSWVFGVGNDYDNAIARTPGANQTIVHQDLSSTGDTYWVQRENAPTLLSGTSVTINDTAPTGDRYNLAICEILPAP
jgi:parallel beta-helix repeat protein